MSVLARTPGGFEERRRLSRDVIPRSSTTSIMHTLKLRHHGEVRKDFYHVILPFSKGKVVPGMFATQNGNLHLFDEQPGYFREVRRFAMRIADVGSSPSSPMKVLCRAG